ncbi:hypothetical protein GIB67_041972 [Kingdonia uniflora]|uniref:Uncharacterized protein n=1 Tax=Kingdonia uniflora TaxID=39325 RepID=A0A7J7NZN3_9MAGN|nr:hypothetical protein GIB67_041972 [Kingdonia uniflora]
MLRNSSFLISLLILNFMSARQMFFATSILHVHLMQWDDVNLVKRAVKNCDEVWEMIPPEKRLQCIGLFFHNELLHTFYLLRICDYKNAKQHVDKLVAAVKSDLEKRKGIQDLTTELNSINQSLSQSDLKNNERSALSAKQTQIQEHLKTVACTESLESSYFGNAREIWGDKLELAPAPIDGEWLPKAAIYALVDLMVVIFGRPKGLFKECGRRIQSGVHLVKGLFQCT